MQKFEIDAVCKRGQKDKFILFDGLSELADFATDNAPNIECGFGGDMSTRESIAAIRNGNLRAVAPSDAFMGNLESIMPASRSWETVDNVIGAVPNIPAYITGNPYNMRLRKRTKSEAAPLRVICDLTSAGGIDADKVEKRGYAILALARLLTAARPVELWCGTALDGGDRKHSSIIMARIETSPMDLARAAHTISHPSVSRGVFYGISKKVHRAKGAWPYGEMNTFRERGAKIMGAVFGDSELLFVPSVSLDDDASIKTPAKWLADKLALYGGLTTETA